MTWHYQWLVAARVPAADRRAGDGRRRAPARTAASIRRRAARRTCRSSSRPAPTGWATAWCGRRTARISPATTASRSSASSSTPRRRARPTPTTSAAALARRGGSSAGRPSSTSATARSSRTRRSTPSSRRRSSQLPLGAIASHDAPTALPQRNLLRHLTWALPSGQSDRAEDRRRATRGRRPAGTRAARRRLRAQHAALVLRPQGGRGRRRRTAPRPGRRADRRRGLHRPVADRPGLVHRDSAALAADVAEQERLVPDDRLLDVRGRRPAYARPVSQTTGAPSAAAPPLAVVSAERHRAPNPISANPLGDAPRSFVGVIRQEGGRMGTDAHLLEGRSSRRSL